MKLSKKQRQILTIIAALIILGVAFYNHFLKKEASVPASPSGSVSLENGELTVVFIDVGQGDSILVISPDKKAMLIDAGEKSEADHIEDVLREYEVEKIDVLVATHPHSDHIGGMQSIVEAHEIGMIYMPNATHTSATFKNLLNALSEKDVSTKQARSGMEIDLGAGVTCEILGPVSEEYVNLNNYSVVIKLTYDQVSFLFTGDAEKDAEEELIQEYGDHLASTVLKLGHHGSSTATVGRFLTYVNPSFAVISCGLNNSYGHPHTEVLFELKAYEILTYRTDELGDIAARTDGKTVAFDKEGAVPEPDAADLENVYVTTSGKAYHKEGCSLIQGKQVTKLLLKEARTQGYTACQNCFSN